MVMVMVMVWMNDLSMMVTLGSLQSGQPLVRQVLEMGGGRQAHVISQVRIS